MSFGTLVLIVLSALFVPLTIVLIGIVAWSVGAAIAIGNLLLSRTFKTPQLHQWYADAGTDARNVRVRECILRSTMVTHAKAVIDRGKEGLLLGSPFNQDYFDEEAEGLVAPYLHAAALTPDVTAAGVYRWILDRNDKDAEKILTEWLREKGYLQ